MKTVSFIEAINSGKRFKPVDRNDHGWFCTQINGVDQGYVMHGGCRQLASIKLIKSRFELEETKVLITESRFNEAWDRACCDYSKPDSETSAWINILKKELGF